MKSLQHTISRTITIQADRETVFSFFTDPSKWAKWWGGGSRIDARPGGALEVHHSNGFVSEGNVLEIEQPERIVFTFGLQTDPLTPPEDSRVTLELSAEDQGTVVRVVHALADPKVRDMMEQGWRFHLSLFANAVANEMYRDVEQRVDEWFAIWEEADPEIRAATIGRLAAPNVVFRDRYACLDGAGEVLAQVAAVQRFMPGSGWARRGPVRHCQGVVLVNWEVREADGRARGTGTSVFQFAFGKIVAVTGMADPS